MLWIHLTSCKQVMRRRREAAKASGNFLEILSDDEDEDVSTVAQQRTQTRTPGASESEAGGELAGATERNQGLEGRRIEGHRADYHVRTTAAHEASTTGRQGMLKRCICEHPEDNVIAGKHMCRLFGSYRCSDCG